MATNDLQLLKFIVAFLTDDGFRCRALFRELTTMQQFPLAGKQMAALVSLEPNKIFDRLKADLAEAVQACRDRLAEISASPSSVDAESLPPEIANDAAALLGMYGEGQIHIRSVDPQTVKLGSGPFRIQLRGQGFGDPHTLEVVFVHGGQPDVAARVVDSSCDPDILQRITVEVGLAQTGRWAINARNPGEPWATSSKGFVDVTP